MPTDAVAIVTGGSSGIGAACCASLASAGFNIAILSRRPKPAESVLDSVRRRGVKAIHLETDVADHAQVKDAIDRVCQTFGAIDVLVNNAGIITPLRYFFDQSDEEWDCVVKAHLYGTFYLMKEVAPRMMARKFGRIINISSGAARSGSCGRANYAAAKVAVEGLTLTAAKELGEFGITVNVVRPGFARTPMTESRNYDFAAIARVVPRQRIGNPEDTARLVTFLAGRESDYITGQIISVDGGWSICGMGLSAELRPLKEKSNNGERTVR